MTGMVFVNYIFYVKECKVKDVKVINVIETFCKKATLNDDVRQGTNLGND